MHQDRHRRAADHLVGDAAQHQTRQPAPAGGVAEDPRHLREVERHHVEEVLEQVKGNKVQAARALGIRRRALYRHLGKYQRGASVSEPEARATDVDSRASGSDMERVSSSTSAAAGGVGAQRFPLPSKPPNRRTTAPKPKS